MHIRSILEELEVSPKKRFGQNFLIHSYHAKEIVKFSGVMKDDFVIEIGPGLGALTSFLLECSSNYKCVEVEPKFIKFLKKNYKLINDTNVILDDVRNINLEKYVPKGKRAVIVSNLPYCVSSEVLLWSFENREFIKRISFLLQREFAERVNEKPGSRKYGILSVYAAIYGKSTLGMILTGKSFIPEVSVDSRLLKIDFYDEPKYKIKDEALFKKVVRQAFSKRRKTLLNSLCSSSLFPSKEEGRKLLISLNINPQKRPETLPPQSYVTISNNL